MKRIAILFIFLTFLFNLPVTPACASGGISLEMDAPIPVSPQLSEKKLKNGLTYYVRRNTEPENRARIMLVVKAGRLQEEDGQRGAAHFVEHMAFNGTKNFPGRGIDRFMESVGMGTCECYSGYTTFSETVYSFWLPTEDIKTLDKGLLILSDIASGISFTPEEIEKERGVMVEEWREGKGRSRENANRMRELLYKGSRYAERLTSNKKSAAEDLDRESILQFYRQWYRPELMAVIVVGDFDEKKVSKLVRKRFKRLKNPTDAPEWKKYDVPDREGTDYLVVTDPDTYTYSLAISDMHKAGELKTVADRRRDVAMDLFIGMLNYRLAVNLLEKDPPYLGASISFGGSVGLKKSFSISVSAEEGTLNKALEAVAYEIGRVMQHGFTETELQRNKLTILKKADDIEAGGFKTYTSSLASELMRHFLVDEPVPGYRNEVAMARGIVPLITVGEVNAVSKRLMAKNNWLILGTAPEGKESTVPGKDDIVALFDNADTIEVAEYVDVPREDELLPVPPVPGKVVSSKKIERFDYLEWKLSNGTTVVLKPTDFEKTEILFRGFSSGGHSLASDDDYPTAVMSAPLVISGGLGNFDILSLSKKLTGKSVSLSPYISELEEGFSGSSTPDDLETMFKLLYLYFTAQRKDDVIFDTLRKRLLLSISIANKQPEKELQDMIIKVLYNNHPRRVPLTEEKVNGMELDKAVSFFKDRFADASDFTFFFVGSFDPDSIRPLVEMYIGGLPATDRQETWKDVGVELPQGVIKREITSGTGEKASVMMFFPGDFEWERKESLELQIAAKVLENMLMETLREDMSGTYGVTVSSSVQKYPTPRYSLSVTFNCSPDKVEPLTEKVFARLDELKEGNGLDKYIDPIIKKKLRSYENSLDENSYWLSRIVYLYKYGVKPDDYVTINDMLEGIAPEGVADSARKHFDLGNYIHIVYYSGT